MNIPMSAWTNKKKAIEIPRRRWMVRTFIKFIPFSFPTQRLDPLKIQKVVKITPNLLNQNLIP
jgi:hypothetical protein